MARGEKLTKPQTSISNHPFPSEFAQLGIPS